MTLMIIQCDNWDECHTWIDNTFRGPDLCSDCEEKQAWPGPNPGPDDEDFDELGV